MLVDKPMALNAQEAEAMVAAAEAHPQQLAIVDHEMRFAPAILRARDLIQAGKIGELGYTTINVLLPSFHKYVLWGGELCLPHWCRQWWWWWCTTANTTVL